MTQAPARVFTGRSAYAARGADTVAAGGARVGTARRGRPVTAVLPAAASPLTSHLLAAAPREATVLAVFPTAVYLRVGTHEQVLPVLAHDALDLPTGLRLARRSDQVEWSVAAGDVVLVGGGRVCLPHLTVAAVRTRRPLHVSRVAGADPACALAALGLATSGLSGAAAEVVAGALEGDPTGSVASLVGGGQGLTPSGDDALCGVLLALRAFGCGQAHRSVADRVRALTGRTTSLSASLLLAAADGYAVPDVVRLVTLLAAGSTLRVTTDWPETPKRPARSRPGGSCQSVVPTLEQVRAIGHSSGRDLAAGLHGALSALAGPAARRPERKGARRA